MKTGNVVGSDRLFSQEAAEERAIAVGMGMKPHVAFKMTAPQLGEWVERRLTLHRLMGNKHPEPVLVRQRAPKHAYTGPSRQTRSGREARMKS